MVVSSNTTDITATGAMANGAIIDVGETGVTSYGWCWSTSKNPTININSIDLGKKNKASVFSTEISNLNPNTKYYLRSYAKGGGKPVYGEELQIQTELLNIETTNPYLNQRIAIGSDFTINWNANISEKITIKLYQNEIYVLTIADNINNSGNYLWSVPSNISESENSIIEISSAKNSNYSAKSDVFTLYHERFPMVRTDNVEDITHNNAKIYGYVLDLGSDLSVSNYGHCWSTSPNPNVYDNTTDYGVLYSIGSFSSDIASLSPNTTYYVKAFAENSLGVTYGDEVSFTTLPEFNYTYGGGTSDYLQAVANANDGGYFLGGYSYSSNYDFDNNKGEADAWITKIDNLGNIEWTKNFGGSQYDRISTIKKTSDGGVVAAGYTESTDGDIIKNNGEYDFLVIKLSSTGIVQWQSTYGGSDNDRAYNIIQTADDGYLVTGSSYSNDADVAVNYGSSDFWTIKLNNGGAIQWQKVIGGTGYDKSTDVIELSDGSYVIAGYSSSSSNYFTENYGSYDFWLFKYSESGNMVWRRNYGGDQSDYLMTIIETSDGGLAVAGYTYSNNYDVNGNHGESDSWVLKLSSLGYIQWKCTTGGSLVDNAYSIVENDNYFYVLGSSESTDGDISSYISGYDYWLQKINYSGYLVENIKFGGSNNDYGNNLILTNDNKLLLAGRTYSKDGYIQYNYGSADYWVLKVDLDFNITSK